MTAESVPTGAHSHLLRVLDVVEETHDARSLVFEIPAEAKERFAYEPGQFLTLRIPSDQTGSVARCYSLSSSPHTDGVLKVTAKRTSDGYGSNWLCDHVTVGMTIEVLPPAGLFVPKSLDDDFLLLAAGSGVTPVMAILKSALAKGDGQVVLLYANRDEKSVIFADELRELAAEHPHRLRVIHWLESVQGLPSRAQLEELSRPFIGYQAFICGPGPFMDVATHALRELGMDRHQIHVELFKSLIGDPFAPTQQEVSAEDAGTAATVEVDLDGTVHSLEWPADTLLLDLLLEKGIDAPFSCRQGACSACACIVKEGEVKMLVNEILDDQDLADGFVLACQALPMTDTVKVTYSE
ncbi:2Fe-2S iron-sulfur cluster-binding protein [Rhodococcus sp. X156]|uniref:2Fe-2S iron-sulfur cluster-binding protein n=1 Tax=Rhodococcus sp. X156 TaxID=2499145 RepID=UPI000FDC33FA|nr:2Fe-2S iron-sulfur cluster-binding protein [Rhodococcus sp. X156]